jgi:hypothetical protein
MDPQFRLWVSIGFVIGIGWAMYVNHDSTLHSLDLLRHMPWYWKPNV